MLNMSSLVDINTLNLLFAPGFNISPEPLILILCKPLLSEWSADPSANSTGNLNLLSSILSSSWCFESASLEVKAKVWDLFSHVLASLDEEPHQSRTSAFFLVTCANLKDPHNPCTEKLTQYLVKTLNGLLTDVEGNFIDSKWHEDSYTNNHVAFVLLDELIQIKHYGCLSVVVPRILEVLVAVKGMSSIWNKISSLLFNSIQIMLRDTQSLAVAKHVIMQLFDHVEQFTLQSINATKRNDHISKYISLIDVALETLQSVEENLRGLESFGMTKLLACILSKPEVWLLFQTGLFHTTAATRKTTVNCLKYSLNFVKDAKLEISVTSKTSDRTIFSSASQSELEIFGFWLCFISICETLEENQIHVIRPVLSKLKQLFSTSKENPIPLSWLLTILQRMLSHDNKHVQEEGITLLMKLDFVEYPIASKSSFDLFISNALLPALKEEAIYYRASDGANENTNIIPTMLGDFFKCCFATLPQMKRDETLKVLFSKLSNSSWSPVSMLFVFTSMMSIPRSKCLGTTELHCIRTLLFPSVQTNKNSVHVALQRVIFLLFLSHTDVSDIALDELLNFLVICVDQALLSRSSALWTKCSEWLMSNYPSQHSVSREWFGQTVTSRLKTLTGTSKDLISNEASININNDAKKLAMLLVMYADVHYLDTEHTQQFNAILKNVMTQVKTITDKAATHPYISQKQILSCFQLINALAACLSPGKEDPVSPTVLAFLWQLWPGIMEFVARKLPAYCSSSCVLECYLDTVGQFLDVYSKTQHKSVILSQGLKTIEALLLSSISIADKIFQTAKVLAKEGTVKMIYLAYKCLSWSLAECRKFCFTFSKSTLNKLSGFCLSLNSQHSNLLGLKVVEKHDDELNTEAVKILWWEIVPFVFDPNLNMKASETSVTNYLLLLLDEIDISSYDSLPTLFTAAKTLLCNACGKETKAPEGSGEICSKVINRLWKTTSDLRNSSVFRCLYETSISAIFQKEVLACQSKSVTNAIKHVLEEIQSSSQGKPSLLLKPVASLAKITYNSTNTSIHVKDVLEAIISFNCGKENKDFGARDIENYCDFLIFCATVSAVPSKSALLREQALEHVKQFLQDKTFLDYTDKLLETNISASALLLQLATNNQEFGVVCLKQLLTKEKAFAKSKDRCHSNSVTHLTKQKLWQNVVLFLPFTSPNSGAELVDEIFQLLNQNAQASIRHLMEWCLCLLILRYPLREEVLLQRLQHNRMEDSTFPAICSCFTVALLLGQAKSNSLKKFQTDYFLRLVEISIPWCMSQHFTIRLCAHAVLQRSKKLFEEMGCLEVLQNRFPCVDTCLNFADNSTGNVKTNWERVKRSPILFHIDPLLDLSIETIFCSIPRLCHMTHPDVAVVEKLMLFQTWIPLRNIRDNLRKLPKSTWLSSVSNKAEKTTVEESIGSNIDHINLQKKIVVSNTQSSKKPGLVLVASLIDKPSNLGGLARTCEVFGAERLVVHSLSCVEDKFFQSLSVTAHKWLRMDEVKKWNLEQYLVDMRSKGYSLIGTEQTEQSKCLSEFRFPSKCVVLLGNEKEGIPPALLRRLDVCVEIPQLGVVRSLNVHVSGAITVWEYAKQAKLAKKP